MKKNIGILILSLSVIVICLIKCDKTDNDLSLIDNSKLKHKVENLKSKISILSVSNDSLTKKYTDGKKIKDSVLFQTKTRYISIYDTILNDTIECLPKIHVDTIISTFENIIEKADSLIAVKDTIISNQKDVIIIQDTIIINNEINEKKLKKQVKKEKRKGNWKFVKGIIFGGSLGYIAGKLF